ncbi:MAG: RNA degradosome polyphosphate kinase [Lachnospiraceae bacterium]|nr:RNA degradosome polyphosphate kinase [Lachnospiraceae bacterium]
MKKDREHLQKQNLNLDNDEYYVNREISWLSFNYRVLSEALDEENPLFERINFLSITASNLDEFFMIRVASLKDMVNARYNKKDISGKTPSEQLKAISIKTHELVNKQYEIYNNFLPMLEKNNIIVIKSHEELSDRQKVFVDEYFREEIYPVLTPMAVDSSRPFPLIRNNSLNICALLYDKDSDTEYDFATVQVPSMLTRFVKIPSEVEGAETFIFMEQIIEKNIDKLFLNYEVICAFPYRIMRNADLTIDEDEAADLLIEIQKQLRKRQWGEAIRLEVEDGIDERLINILIKELGIQKDDIYYIDGPLDLTVLRKVHSLDGYSEFKNEPFIPQPVKGLEHYENIFDEIAKRDILLHHPYYSFEPVVDFVRQAAKDPNVLAIKQTLYRVSSNSPIIASLAQAAENGKQVSVLVELKARFDEENNILWAKKLEKAGCHVIYGLKGLKTHSKITLVVRREEDGIKRYVHLGTGNYNDSTAKLYTDMGLFTCDNLIGEDATAVFNMLSGYSEPLTWNKLALAPLWLRDKFIYLINRERDNALAGKKAAITAKMNSLCDKSIIKALYEASAAGVQIDLVIRGICCLKAGIPGVSENIRVRSLIGRFLEHSRIFVFHNDGDTEIYMGSADWMPRNLDKRVEILFPVEDTVLKDELLDIMAKQLLDTERAHVMQPDGKYIKEKVDDKDKLDSQRHFVSMATSKNKKKKRNSKKRVFEPRTK